MPQSHYQASVFYRHKDETDKDASARRRAQYKALGAAGFESWKVFAFEDGNTIQEAKAKELAEADTKKWAEIVGFELQVTVGFFI